MTMKKTFKNAVRERMVKTGESFSAARFNLRGDQGGENAPSGPHCSKCGQLAVDGWSETVTDAFGAGTASAKLTLCSVCSSSLDEEQRGTVLHRVHREQLSRITERSEHARRRMETLRSRFLPCPTCSSRNVVASVKVKLNVVEQRQDSRHYTVTCEACGTMHFEVTLPGGSTDALKLPAPLKVKPMRVIEGGPCAIRSDVCTAAEVSADKITMVGAVAAEPDGRKISVCLECTVEMIARGAWEKTAPFILGAD